MTVAIPEAAARSAGSTRASAGRARARQSRPTQAQMGRAGPRGSEGSQGPRGPRGAAAGTRTRTTPGGSRVSTAGGGSRTSTARPSTRQASKSPQEARERLSKGDGKSKRRDGLAGRLTGASTRSGSTLHNYQAIIAAEYVAATLLVALTPMASRKATASVTSGALSPYVATDIMQIFALGIVYLILEGVAAGPRGAARFAAWFGFLIMLGVGLFEASRIADVFKMLAGGDVSATKLTGASAPVQKGGFTIPPLGQATGSSTAGTGGSSAGTGGSGAGEGGSGAGEGSGGPLTAAPAAPAGGRRSSGWRSASA